MDNIVKNGCKVSICCITYNHEKYIGKALDSFLKQKTDFPFEVIIHDDASTDKTAYIIREYEKKYPNIIKPVYQTENQHSQGKKILVPLVYPKAEGKYIALCEGDDFWIDEYKLQKQVDILEKNDSVSLVVTDAVRVNTDNEKISDFIICDKDSSLTFEDIILLGGGGISTNSMCYRKKFINELPDFYLNACVGDYFLAIYLSLCGDVYYLKDKTAAYRVGDANSWTALNLNNVNERYAEHYVNINNSLKEIDAYTNFKYHGCIKWQILKNSISALTLISDKNGNKSVLSSKYYKLFKEVNMKYKLIFIGCAYLPGFKKLFDTLKGKNK